MMSVGFGKADAPVPLNNSVVHTENSILVYLQGFTYNLLWQSKYETASFPNF